MFYAALEQPFLLVQPQRGSGELRHGSSVEVGGRALAGAE